MKKNLTRVVSGKRPVYIRTGKNGEGRFEDRSIEAFIDWDALLRRLGSRAANSKTGKATALSGLIVVKEVR